MTQDFTLDGKLEVPGDGPTASKDYALTSIAVSLKRIADAVATTEARPDLYNLVTDLAWQAGQAFERGRGAA